MKNALKILVTGTSLVVQWLRLHTLNVEGLGLTPSQGTGYHMPQLRPGAPPPPPKRKSRDRMSCLSEWDLKKRRGQVWMPSHWRIFWSRSAWGGSFRNNRKTEAPTWPGDLGPLPPCSLARHPPASRQPEQRDADGPGSALFLALLLGFLSDSLQWSVFSAEIVVSEGEDITPGPKTVLVTQSFV